MNEPIQVPMPGAALSILMKKGGKREYNLSELTALIDPVYQVYTEQVRRCISGLTSYAAQCAATHREEQLPELRQQIVTMGGFWGTVEDISVDTYDVAEQTFGRSFDAAVEEARRTGAAPPLAEQAMRDVLIGLEVHAQEMDNSGGLEDLIAEYDLLSQQLREEWKMELPASQRTVLTMEGMSLHSHPPTSAISAEEQPEPTQVESLDYTGLSL